MANENDARTKTLALIIKFGHDLFERKDLKSTASAAVNNSHGLLGFRSSALFRLSDQKKCTILGQFGQSEANEHSNAANLQAKLVSEAEFSENGTVIIANGSLPRDLADQDSVYLLCKLDPPGSSKLNCSYIWLLEYDKTVPEQASATAQLLGKSIAEALSLAETAASGSRWRISKFFSKAGKITGIVLILAGVMFIPVRESSTAEFMLTAPEVTASYAWFDGAVSECLKQDGSTVRKGEPILRFDTSELQYRLANARSSLKEAEADHELALQNSFTDESKLGKVKLLRAKCEILQVAVKEAEWYLSKSEIQSNADGILVLMEERAEQLTGKAVKTGDKLFEIFGGDGMIAEIMVNERDSSILQDQFDADLFLHTAPEKGISGEILSVSRYPVLNEQKQYCYPVRMKLQDNGKEELRYGMRGVAKLSGKHVCLGYYLFKSMILSFRNW